jgi:hypothetical protein
VGATLAPLCFLTNKKKLFNQQEKAFNESHKNHYLMLFLETEYYENQVQSLEQELIKSNNMNMRNAHEKP